MPPPFVVPLALIRQTDAPRVGGKAAVLGELLAMGFPVPAGVCVTTDAFHWALTHHEAQIQVLFQQSNLRDPQAAAQAATAIAQQLTDLSLPVAIITELAALLPALGDENTWLAVRSSATAEDRAEASYAGQYVTNLGVRGIDGVQQAILTCWRSFFSANGLAARATHGALAASEGMAVLIQPLLAAECAGVCFSVDPVQQRRDLIVVTAAWGLGVGVVDGAVATDTAWVQRENFQVERQRIVEKPLHLMLDATGNLSPAPVSVERQRAACLPGEWLARVAQFAVAAEVLLGAPQDVEWAVADGQFWVLQSRPLTALPANLAHVTPFPVSWANEEDRRLLWQRPSKDEVREVLLPLEQDHLVQLAGTREEACRILGVERDERVIYCNGHAYTRPVPIRWTEADRRVRRTAMLDLRERLHEQNLTTWDHWGPEIVKATERLRAFNRAQTLGPALADHLQMALAVYRRHYILHPMMSFTPPHAYFAAYAAVADVTVEQAETVAWRFLEGSETPLTQLIDQLYVLAQLARQAPDVAALLIDAPPDLFAQLQATPAAAPFLVQLADFLLVYGERNGGGWGSEIPLRTRTWQEQPEIPLRLVAQYLDAQIEAPTAVRLRTQQTRSQEMETLCAACTDLAAIAEFRRQLIYARKVVTVLELHNHYIDQLSTGQLRQAVMAAATWLVAQGALAVPDDVFWLRFDEIVNALQTDHPAPFTATIASRQADYAVWLTLDAPPILGVPAAQLPERPAWQDEVIPETASAEGRLTGQGASPGQVRGQARLAVDALQLPDLAPGAILVAENIGPLWTPIFPRLGGLVLESGSLGQHAAATAREYGIPAVVNVKDARRRILDGAWITVDGTTGIVEMDSD